MCCAIAIGLRSVFFDLYDDGWRGKDVDREHSRARNEFVSLLGMEFSQAQMISLVLMILGVVGFVWGGMMRDRKMKKA